MEENKDNKEDNQSQDNNKIQSHLQLKKIMINATIRISQYFEWSPVCRTLRYRKWYKITRLAKHHFLHHPSLRLNNLTPESARFLVILNLRQSSLSNKINNKNHPKSQITNILINQ